MMFTRKKMLWLIPSILILVFLFMGNIFPRESYKQHPNIFLIPKGYVGWIEIHYGLKDYPPLPKEDGSFILQIPESGILKTSNEPSYKLNKFYYVDKNGNRIELQPDVYVQRGSIGNSEEIASDGSVKKHPTVERHFVGTNEQWEQWLEKNKQK